MRITLPVPPSTNTLFRNVPGRGRVPTGHYQRWQKEARDRFWGVSYQMFEVPVVIHIALPDKRGPDVDNCSKAVIDTLVKMRVILDDSRKYVRGLSVRLEDVPECVVEVREAA